MLERRIEEQCRVVCHCCKREVSSNFYLSDAVAYSKARDMGWFVSTDNDPDVALCPVCAEKALDRFIKTSDFCEWVEEACGDSN